MGTEILSQEGFDVLGITDGRQVLESLDRFAPDLVLADVSLPEHSGYEICERIKSNPALGHVKVVLVVGAAEPFDRAEAQRVRADGVLLKPFEPSLVIETIGPLLKSGPAPDEAAFEKAVQAAMPGPPIDPGQVRAAVLLALEAALPSFVDEVSRRVVDALRQTER